MVTPFPAGRAEFYGPPRRRWLIALILPLLSISCATRDRPPAQSTPTATRAGPTESPAQTPGRPSPDAISAFSPGGRPRSLGEGVLVGLSSDGEAAYATAERPESGEVGCEGSPAQFLFSVPLDGGTRKLASEQLQPISAGPERSPDGKTVFIAEYCEEFFVRILTAEERPGGTLADVREVGLPQESGFRLYRQPQWSPDSKSLISAAVKDPQGESGQASVDIVRIDPRTGRVTVVRPNVDAVVAAEFPNGDLLLVTTDKKVKVGDRQTDFEGFNIAMAPDLRSAAVFGADGVMIVAPGREPQRLTRELAFTGSWSPDSKAVIYNNRQGSLLYTVIGGSTSKVADGAQYGPALMAPDGRRIVYTYEPAPGDRPGPPTLRIIESR